MLDQRQKTCQNACRLFHVVLGKWLHKLYDYANVKLDIRGWRILRVQLLFYLFNVGLVTIRTHDPEPRVIEPYD